MDERRRKSPLPKRVQDDLIEQVVAGAIARMAADHVGVNRHTATLYFHNFSELIALKLAVTEPWLSGEIDVDESYSAAPGKGSAEAARQAEFQYSGCSRGAARSTSLLFRMPNKIR